METYSQSLISDPDFQQVLVECARSTEMVAKVFFPERFSKQFAPAVHGKIFSLIDDPTLNKVAIAAPRGWGKTSIVALALCARYILFRLSPFVVYINMSHDAAALQTENLRRELVANQLIKKIFGSVKIQCGDKEFEETFSRRAWVAYDTLVWPRGAGQQIRGVLFKNSRPGLIVLDDLENTENITNEEFRRRQKEWFYADVIKAVPRITMDWKIVYIDTVKHEDSLLQHLLDSPDWASVRLEACDDDFEPTAPEFMSKETILREWESHKAAGQTDVFYREFRNLPIATADATFRAEYFRYYNIPHDKPKREGDLDVMDFELSENQNVENYVIVDPAKTVKLHAAESAVIGVGIDLANARIYVRDIFSGRVYPDELYDMVFGMAVRLKAVAIGIEETSLNEFIRQPIRSEMFRRGLPLNVEWLKPRGGLMKKEDRIKSLLPYYRLGYVYHNRAHPKTSALESQLLMFPRSKLMDIMDALAYVLQLMEVSNRHFMPSDDISNREEDYKDLKYEPPLDDWRLL